MLQDEDRDGDWSCHDVDILNTAGHLELRWQILCYAFFPQLKEFY